MYRTWLIPITVSLAAGCGNPSNNNMDAGTTRSLVLLHTNDEHSHILGDTPESDDYPAPTTAGTGMIRGGLSRRATVLQQERDAAKAAGKDTLTVSAGDNSMGSLFQVAFPRSAPDYTLMKALGYDVTTIGNHELDYGPDALAAAISAAKTMGGVPVIVASNITFPADPKVDKLKALYDDGGTDDSKPVHKTWIITTPNGLKVGFIGTLGADASYSAPAKAPLTFSLPSGAKETEYAKVEAQAWVELQAAADQVKAQGANIVVLLSHAGIDTTDDSKGEDNLIATNVTGIDVIVSGHTHALYPIKAVTNPTTMKPVYIQQANYYGYDLGKIVLDVDMATGTVTADMTASTVIPIDDKIVASNAMINSMVDASIRDIESTKLANGKSFIEGSLSQIMGTAVTDNGTAGNLFFKTVATTGFDLLGHPHLKEAPFEVLYADAEMFAGDKYKPAGKTNDVAVIASGVIRADLLAKGKTGNIGFSDLFKMLPLGASPVDGTPGVPLCRFSIYPAELRGALELTTSYAYSNLNADGFFFVTSGLKMEYDTNRAPFDFSNIAGVLDPTKGRVIKIWMSTDHANPDNFPAAPIYDANNAAYASTNGWDPAQVPMALGGMRFNIIASSYIAGYAASQGITIKDDTGATITLAQAILHRTDGSEIKDWEALGEFLISKGGAVPAAYNAGTTAWPPHRVICDGPLCVQ